MFDVFILALRARVLRQRSAHDLVSAMHTLAIAFPDPHDDRLSAKLNAFTLAANWVLTPESGRDERWVTLVDPLIDAIMRCDDGRHRQALVAALRQEQLFDARIRTRFARPVPAPVEQAEA